MLESSRTGSRKEAIQRIWSPRKQKGHLKVLHWVVLKHLKSVLGNGGTRVTLVVNYTPILCHLGQVMRKNLCFPYQDEEVKQVFNPAPFA